MKATGITPQRPIHPGEMERATKGLTLIKRPSRKLEVKRRFYERLLNLRTFKENLSDDLERDRNILLSLNLRAGVKRHAFDITGAWFTDAVAYHLLVPNDPEQAMHHDSSVFEPNFSWHHKAIGTCMPPQRILA